MKDNLDWILGGCLCMQPVSWKRNHGNKGRALSYVRSRSTPWGSPRPPSQLLAGGRRWLRRLGVQSILVLVLSVFTLGIFHIRSPIVQPVTSWLVDSLHKDMNFIAVKAWYQKNIGSIPSFLPVFSEITGRSAEPRSVVTPASSRTGVRTIANRRPFVSVYLPARQKVSVTRPGKVLSVVMIPHVGYRMMIQHANDWATCLEGIQNPHVRVQDKVRVGQSLGEGGEDGHLVTLSAWYQGRPVDSTGWFSLA